MGGLSSYQAPSLGTGPVATVYSYNYDRQLTQVSKPTGQTIQLSYDATTGLLDQMSSGTNVYSYTYSGDQLSTSASADGVTLTYSNIGSLPSVVESSGSGKGKITFDYNNYHQLVSTQIGTGTTYTYLYDADELLTKAGAQTITRSSSTGLVSSTTLGNATEVFTYSSDFGELASYQAKHSANNKLLESYTRDALGRITSRVVTVGAGSANTWGYVYDAAGRLTTVTLNGSTYASYVYDGNSNRTSVTRSGVVTSATFDAQDRVLTHGTQSFSYNLNGERTQKVDSSSGITTNYTWDAFGNLKSAQVGTTTYNYKYDGQNRRVTRLTGTTVNERYVYLDQTRIAAVLNNNGGTTITYIWGHKANTPEYMIKSGTTYKLITDHVGSIRQVMKTSDGTIAQEITYDEFGRVLSDTSPGFQPLGFAGGLYDKDTKLTHFGARSYDAEVGRWLSKDPILFAGGDTNLYGYVLQDPVNLIDPTGNCPMCIAAGAGAVAGAVGGAIGGAMMGGNYRDILRAASMGAVNGALAGALASVGGLGMGVMGQGVGFGYNLITIPADIDNPSDFKNGVRTLKNNSCPPR